MKYFGASVRAAAIAVLTLLLLIPPPPLDAAMVTVLDVMVAIPALAWVAILFVATGWAALRFVGEL